MTRDEQDTQRALVIAERNWLLARGWQYSGNVTFGPAAERQQRFKHAAAPKNHADYNARDAVNLTRSDPLRFRARSFAGPA